MATANTANAVHTVASLPMYDWPEVSPVVDRLWDGVAQRLGQSNIDAPQRLDRRHDFKSVWREPGLLLSQTCGYPYVKDLRGTVALVGAPVYAVPGCVGATYRSFLIVRRDDPASSIAELRGRRAAINGRDSQSGYSALRATVAPFAEGERFFSEVTVSGGHRASIRTVAGGEADVAATDAVCWALAERHEPAAFAKLRVLAESPIAPSLPFITSPGSGASVRSALLDALRGTLAADPGELRRELFLTDIAGVEDQIYDRILEIEQLAVAQGYPEVA